MREIGALKGSVHEMEDATGRYPWAGKDGAGYTRAYRYFVDKCRMLAPNALFVWSPKGELGAEMYYPGDAHVDYVGFSLYAAQKFEIAHYGKSRPAVEILSARYSRMSAPKKPVLIAELGVAGDNQYVENRLVELWNNVARFPLLRAMVYFNEKEPYELPEPFGSPDWRLGIEIFLGPKVIHLRSKIPVSNWRWWVHPPDMLNSTEPSLKRKLPTDAHGNLHASILEFSERGQLLFLRCTIKMNGRVPGPGLTGRGIKLPTTQRAQCSGPCDVFWGGALREWRWGRS